jgi:endonuclease G
VSLTIPLRVSFSVDGLPERVSLATDLGDDSAPATEAVQPDPRDPRYARRPGYDAGFLGVRVPFPRLTAATRSKAFALPGLDGDERFVLKYHHYSVLFNKERRLAFAAGVNFDPTARFTHQRENDRWFYDPRVPRDLQAGESLYSGNPLDRGHLVRRADAGWGRSASEAKLANDDTFHFTNCSPQHSITNQGRLREAPPGLKLWGKLEDHVASQGRSDRARLCVFNGPVFRADDEEYRGVLLPREFWKVVAYRAGGSVKAAAFVLTQEGLIDGLEEEFQPGEYAAVQVRIQDLESKTGLDFGSLTDADALEQEGAEESFSAGRPAVFLRSTEDVVL